MGIPFLTINTVLIPFPPLLLHPINFPSLNFSLPPLLYWSPDPADRAVWCSVQLIAVLLQLCNCIYCHLRTRRKYLLHSEQQLASGGATSAPTRPPPPQLLRSIFQFSFSAPCSINHFLVLPGSASSASVVSCQSLRSGCPGSRNPRLAGKNARLCFETDFLVLQSGGQVVS